MAETSLLDSKGNAIAYIADDNEAPCVRIVVASNFKKKIKFEIRNEKI